MTARDSGWASWPPPWWLVLLELTLIAVAVYLVVA